MFRKSRIKIVASIMSILVSLFIGTLVFIFASSYYEVLANNYDMLKRHADMYMSPKHIDSPNRLKPEPDQPKNKPKNDPGRKHFENNPAFQLSTFYSVAISEDGSVFATDNAEGDLYEDEILERYAVDILSGDEERGIKGNFIFLVTEGKDFVLVNFMDNTILQESMTTLFRYTLVFGSVALVALFFLAVHLAKHIVKPLEEIYQKQKRFISDAGHELKTPVSVVSANAELLSREIGDNQWLANIQYENERMGKLVSQLLELARTENVILQTERMDFSRLVVGGALPFESVAFEKGLVLNTKITEHISIIGNSSQLSQLISILIDNAIQHGQGGKEVEVTLIENRNSAILTVINDGEPIPPDKTEQLFERFYRVDEARNGEDKHYGLGLAIAKAIVSAHHGKIEISCYDCKVSFTVKLPKM